MPSCLLHNLGMTLDTSSHGGAWIYSWILVRQIVLEYKMWEAIRKSFSRTLTRNQTLGRRKKGKPLARIYQQRQEWNNLIAITLYDLINKNLKGREHKLEIATGREGKFEVRNPGNHGKSLESYEKQLKSGFFYSYAVEEELSFFCKTFDFKDLCDDWREGPIGKKP